MVDRFDEFRKAVVADGWIAINPAAFRKNGYELVFDTSDFIEIYCDGQRVTEAKVSSVPDIQALLALLALLATLDSP